jgi:uncharacterized repeat protein (TIGR01451 family)
MCLGKTEDSILNKLIEPKSSLGFTVVQLCFASFFTEWLAVNIQPSLIQGIKMKSYAHRYFKYEITTKLKLASTVFLLASSQVGFSAAIHEVSLTLKATPHSVAANSNLTYSLLVKNIGPLAVTNVILKDQLPAGVIFKSASPNCTFINNIDKNKKLITCQAKKLLTKTSVAWSITVKTPPKNSNLKNNASVMIKEQDTNPALNNISIVTTMGSANRAPVASAISLKANPAIPYIEQKLIGTDADRDTLSYILDAPEKAKGYTLAYVSSHQGVMHVTIAPKFIGTISLPYRVTDGKLFSKSATVKIVVQPGKTTKKGLGALPINPKVYASFSHTNYSGSLLGTPGKAPSVPASVDLSPGFPMVGDQGQQNSCVAWATAYALKSYQEGVEMKWPLTNTHLFSPAYIYNQINGGHNNGSSISDALDLIIKKGAATLITAPYNDTDYLSQPTAAAKKEAAQFKGKSKSVVNGTNAIKAALVNRKPVVIGMDVYDQFYNLIGVNSVYNSKSGSFYGGHAITIVGYDDNRYGGAFKIINSWGSSKWGDNGYFWLPYKFAEQVVHSAFVMEDGKNTITPKKPDVIDPPVNVKLPNLQIKSWKANYDSVLGGDGAMEWSVINSGTASAPAGATVAVMLSKDNTINANDTYVVYEKIPFAMGVGGGAHRSFDEKNDIPFKIRLPSFPS